MSRKHPAKPPPGSAPANAREALEIGLAAIAGHKDLLALVMNLPKETVVVELSLRQAAELAQDLQEWIEAAAALKQ